MKKSIHLIFMILITGCANVSMPTGGKKDEIPPTLESSSPAKDELNVSTKSLEFTFSEDIKLKDPKEEILIVPAIGKNTLFTVKKRKLVIEPDLALLDNTTYSINFRDGVQDITEGNPAENLRLAFSTGPTIDSLAISGTVKDTFTEKVPIKITIAIYQSDTFDIFKHTPTYFTKSNEEGKFSIQNLKQGTYFIYAFEDKNKNLKVDSKTEKFGYLLRPIEPSNSKDSLTIAMSNVDSRPLAITSIKHTDKNSRLRFNKQLDSLSILSLTKEESIYSYGTDRSELIFYNAFPKQDSIKVNIFAKDSVGHTLDTVVFLKHGDLKTAEETFKTKELDQHFHVGSKKFTYKLGFNKPIGMINYDSIYIRYDSLNLKKLDPKQISIDTLKNEINFESTIELVESKEEKKKTTPPKFTIGKGGLISVAQDSSKRIMRNIEIQKEEDLGTVAIKIETAEKNYVIEMITTDNKVIQSIQNTKEYTFKNLPPIEYKIRVIIDSNKNGKWDIGSFQQRTESERIVFYKSEEGKYSFPLRANWEVGPLLIKF
jgi:uncharacterized protein (DUF2141 family)